MEKLDLEAMRSKYSDLTVTAIPKGGDPKEKSKSASVEPSPHVEITRIAVDGSNKNCDAEASDIDGTVKKEPVIIGSEYMVTVTKLEEVFFKQAQLARLTKALPFHVDGPNVLTNMDLWDGYPGTGMHPGMPVFDTNNNIDKKYNELLEVVRGMSKTIPLCLQGLRIPKDRLQVDISNARKLIRDCKTILENDM